MNVIVDTEELKLEEKLLNLTLEEVFDILHWRLDQTGKPQNVGVQYQDVLFEITCKPVSEKIVPRGYE